MDEAEVSRRKKRRGVVRASITRLRARIKDLEGTVDRPDVAEIAKRHREKLQSLDSEFKTQHYEVIDAITGDEVLQREQDVIDEHDDIMSLLTTDLDELIKVNSAVTRISSVGAHDVQLRRLTHLERNLASVHGEIQGLPKDSKDPYLLRQYADRLTEFKAELKNIRDFILPLEDTVSADLFTFHDRLDKVIFDCGHEVRKLLGSSVASSHGDSKGVKLPKLEVPHFDGSPLNWSTFWEQFCVSVHDQSKITDSEKLVYLRQALKDGPATHAIEGLSRSGDNYMEAVDCLKHRYDRPRLIHRTHVQMIVDYPSLKEGAGKEIRRLYDKVQQHLRALKAMGNDPPGPFITSVIELKLDENTMFEWQKHSQSSPETPHYNELLEFLNMRAQASETHAHDPSRKSTKFDTQHHRKGFQGGKTIASFIANVSGSASNCVLCKDSPHPLYVCSKFKCLTHDQMVSTLKEHGICMNCLRPGHFVKQCKSVHYCRKCQKPHHTLLHVEKTTTTNSSDPQQVVSTVSANTAVGLSPDSLLMTCRVQAQAPDGSTVEVRALLDSASSVSFISERLAQSLCLPCSPKKIRIDGIAGLSHQSHGQSVTQFILRAKNASNRKFEVTAIIVPRVTRDLPIHPVPFRASWKHLSDVPLADPYFGQPGRVDILLGVDVYVRVLLHGQRIGPPDAPVAFETEFGWVLAGNTGTSHSPDEVTSCHVLHYSSDDLIRKFWETEECPTGKSSLSPEERFVVDHFSTNHSKNADGRFVVPLPMRSDTKPLGESRSQAVRRYLMLEQSLLRKGKSEPFNEAVDEYFKSSHAEVVPPAEINKPLSQVFYLPMHIVYKESSSTTKLRVVFDASAKSSTGVSLNDLLLIGPTVHSSLVEVLLRFRLYRVALITDVSRMYRAVSLPQSDRDLHRFVWRRNPNEPLTDYRMTRVTFGVSASSFAANMAVKQNALDHSMDFPLAAAAVEKSFYVDDGLSGADSVDHAIELYSQLQGLFGKGGFLLRKWNSSERAVLNRIPAELIDSQSTRTLSDPDEYTKTLGIQWNSKLDSFRLNVVEPSHLTDITKRRLVSDIGKFYDVLGWFSPVIIKAKILLQRVWEARIDWDDLIPQPILGEWLQWRSELGLLANKHVDRCYYPKAAHITSFQLHGFSDASEEAYAGVIYLRMTDTDGQIHISLVSSKTKVAPIKRLTVPRLELCGANLLAHLLHSVKEALNLPLQDVFAWVDSTIVLNWLDGNPRRFKTYVGNRIACIMELIPSNHWRHVSGSQNPADCASRGLFPHELLEHPLWWNGPDWLKQSPDEWPNMEFASAKVDDSNEVCLASLVTVEEPVLDLNRYSSFSKMKRVTAWILRFANNCCARRKGTTRKTSPLTTEELVTAETYWVRASQREHFCKEIETLKLKKNLSRSSCLLSLNPFADSSSLLRVGGRQRNSNGSYASQHPVILHGKHPVVKLIIHSEHVRLLHAGPQLLASMLGRRFHIIGHRKSIRSITRRCVTCRKNSARPKPQMQGQLPMERITPDAIFERTGIDYAGPLLIKHGFVRKPIVIKSYICVFVSLTVKAVHLELVSDLTTDAFIACLRRFVARRGLPSLIWSDHGSNFVGARRELTELSQFLELQKSQKLISDFCSSHNICWKFIPEHAPNFGGIWEAAVKSYKTHFKRVVGNITLTFEEASTVLAQIEACLNSRPLVPSPFDDEGVEALTPGHFLIGRPLTSLPDPSFSYRSISLLKRWHLCQHLVRRFWRRWSTEYIASLRKITKRHHPSRNITVGDLVTMHEDNLVPGKWPLARVTEIHPGRDGVVRVVTLKTPTGTYKRPVAKVALVLPTEL